MNAVWRTPGRDSGRDIQGEWFVEDLSGHIGRQVWYIECKRHKSSVSWPKVWEKISFAEIRRNVVDLSGDLLTNLVLFDLYSGQNVEKGYKSLAIGLILQNVSCTLTDEVVDSLVKNVVQGLEQRLDAQLRG